MALLDLLRYREAYALSHPAALAVITPLLCGIDEIPLPGRIVAT